MYLPVLCYSSRDSDSSPVFFYFDSDSDSDSEIVTCGSGRVTPESKQVSFLFKSLVLIIATLIFILSVLGINAFKMHVF